MAERLKAFLENHELSMKGIALALVVHEFLGVGLLSATWAGCYYLQPSKLAALLVNNEKVVLYMEKAKTCEENHFLFSI